MLAIVGTAALLAITGIAACTGLVLTRVQDDVLTLTLDDVRPGSARLVPLIRFGADTAGRTHGLWVVRRGDGPVVALLTIDPHSGCRVEWRADRQHAGVSPIFRDPCTGSIYDGSGRRLFGPAPRGLDRFPASIDFGARAIVIDADQLQLGPCSPGVSGDVECTRLRR